MEAAGLSMKIAKSCTPTKISHYFSSVLGVHSSHKYNYITSYIIILKLMKGIHSHKLYGNLSSDYQTFSC